MKITLDLSEDVWRLIEYLPEDMLPAILSDIIKEAILSKSSVAADDSSRVQSSKEINSLIEQIQTLVATGVTVPTIEEVPAKKKKSEKVKAKVEVVASSDVGDIDPDFLAMMKM